MHEPHPDLLTWLARDVVVRDRFVQALHLGDPFEEATLREMERRLVAGDPPALHALAAALIERGWPLARVVCVLMEQLHGSRAQEMARLVDEDTLRDELLAEAHALFAGSPADWADHLVRYADHTPDGMLNAVIRMAGAAAVAPLVLILKDPQHRDPESESEGWAAIHAAMLLGAVADEAAIGPLLDLLPELEPGEPLVDAIEASLKGFGEAVRVPTFTRIEATDEPELHLAWLSMLARTDIDDDRIRDGLVALLPFHPADAAYSLATYGDESTLSVVMSAFDALDDEQALDVLDTARAVQILGGTLSAEQQARVEAAERRLDQQERALLEEPAQAPEGRRLLSPAQKTAARQQKKVKRQMKKKSRPKKKK